ncbi:MAG: hypothetical protein ACR2F8_04815 [Caulobacteraceae bacterium]
MVTIDGVCFGCDVVRSIDRTLAPARCTCGGNVLPLRDFAAFSVARLAHRLGGGYYVHSAVVGAAADIDRDDSIEWGHTREVARNDGTTHLFASDHYLREAIGNEEMKDDLSRVWLTGALLHLADALEKRSYFDRAPLLELIRHLRNGASHGNRFRIDKPVNLVDYPANNFNAEIKSSLGTSFEITAALQGVPVMFDYMGPGDYVDLFFSVEVHLLSLAAERA